MQWVRRRCTSELSWCILNVGFFRTAHTAGCNCDSSRWQAQASSQPGPANRQGTGFSSAQQVEVLLARSTKVCRLPVERWDSMRLCLQAMNMEAGHVLHACPCACVHTVFTYAGAWHTCKEQAAHKIISGTCRFHCHSTPSHDHSTCSSSPLNWKTCGHCLWAPSCSCGRPL